MNNFYVYCYKDQNGPFYIGKGSGDRKLDHLKAAERSKKNTHFLNRIRKLIRESTPPIIEIIQDDLSEEQSFALEIQLIKQYGRFDRGLGPLLNETDGGDGSSGHISPRKGKTFDEYYGLDKATKIKDKLSKHMLTRHDEIVEMNKRVHTSKKISQETIEKTRQKNIGQKRTEEQLHNMRMGMRGIKKTLSDDQIQAKKELASKTFKNSPLINDGVINKRILFEDLQSYLDQGWKRGKVHIPKEKKPSRSGTQCEVDGVIYDSISIAAEAKQTTTYLIKIDPTFRKLISS